MDKLGTIRISDQDFGNEWNTELRFSDGSTDIINGERPKQYYGVHGLINLFEDEYHLMKEDDGYFWTAVILSQKEVKELHNDLKLILKIDFKDNRKVYLHTKLFISNGLITIKPRENNAPLININIKNKDILFDAYWLPSLVKVLDI
jgi:hypothetical protein